MLRGGARGEIAMVQFLTGTAGFSDFVASIAALIATGWNDSCRTGAKQDRFGRKLAYRLRCVAWCVLTDSSTKRIVLYQTSG